MALWRMRIACCMAHAHCMLDTQGYKQLSEYVILIFFPLQQ